VILLRLVSVSFSFLQGKQRGERGCVGWSLCKTCLLLLIRVCVLMTNVIFFSLMYVLIWYCVDLLRLSVLTFSECGHKPSKRDPVICSSFQSLQHTFLHVAVTAQTSCSNDKGGDIQTLRDSRVFGRSC
jgi:hypothetical protein